MDSRRMGGDKPLPYKDYTNGKLDNHSNQGRERIIPAKSNFKSKGLRKVKEKYQLETFLKQVSVTFDPFFLNPTSSLLLSINFFSQAFKKTSATKGSNWVPQ